MTPVGICRLQYATGIGLLLFWLAFFTIGLAPASPPVGYVQFERSFTVPDILLAGALILSAWWRGQGDARVKRRGETLAVACGGALMFLGALDVSFNLQNGIYSGALGDAAGALAINVWCLVFGAMLVREAIGASTRSALLLGLALLPADGPSISDEPTLERDRAVFVRMGGASLVAG